MNHNKGDGGTQLFSVAFLLFSSKVLHSSLSLLLLSTFLSRLRIENDVEARKKIAHEDDGDGY